MIGEIGYFCKLIRVPFQLLQLVTAFCDLRKYATLYLEVSENRWVFIHLSKDSWNSIQDPQVENLDLEVLV